LLKELLEKKRWLDTVIEGLEKAVNSPGHQLIEITDRVFTELANGRPKVDLGLRQQKKLARLAGQVGGKRHTRLETRAA
jgi:hypothetical protein